MKTIESPAAKTGNEALRIFKEEYAHICRRTDRLIAIIMALQWPGAILAALLMSPRAWEGGVSAIHPHLVAAIYIGGLVTIFPVYLALANPGERFTRHVLAACQMLMSGLLIHISDGRIETHFHVFVSLALLAFYLDWQVLLTATAVVLLDHSVMTFCDPASLFGTSIAGNWRFVEHVLWVVFFDFFLITSCIQNLKGTRAIAKREADQVVLLYQAYHDPLTSLGNRLVMQMEIARLRALPTSSERSFALMALDLDRFKEVNDTLGHQTGDTLLTLASERLREQIRNHDTLVRMGGDEFAIVVAGCSDNKPAEEIAGRIVESFKQPFQCGKHTVHIGVSIGICLNPQGELEDLELFHHADLALYKVKNTGRNHFFSFDEEMRAAAVDQTNLEQRLRNAILEEALHLHYQPIVTTSGKLLGFEALLRWNDPVHGNISPGVFIPAAERTGLIVPLGRWVMHRACAQAAEWHRAGRSLVKMSVNVSPLQLAHYDFASTILRALEETGLPPGMLDIELTESTLIQNHSQTRKALDILRDFGVRLSLDDFGTGYSSLSYLKDLPVHTLKIDRSFIKDIVYTDEARQLVESMIDMAHNLHLKVVAEGVEDGAQMDLLRLAGCDEIQGFYISQAVSAQEAASLFDITDQIENRKPSRVMVAA